MGQKVHPYGFRLGVTKTWRSRWFSKHDYARLLEEDLDLKKMLRKRLKSAGVSSIELDRPGNKLRITIRTSRPGIVIGRKGSEIEKLKQDLAKSSGRDVFIDIQEVHKPELDAQLVTESIALQLEKRVAFRRAMRKAVDSALRFGCQGIKVRVSGRLNGNEIARSEWYLQGRLPLHTLRADIDYGFTEAYTTYGVIGIKAWVYRGEILDGSYATNIRNEPEPRRLPPRRTRERRAAQPAPPPIVTESSEGGAVQAPPDELPQPAKTAAPVIPPLAPPQPSWKQDTGSAAPGATAAPDSTETSSPAGAAATESAEPTAPEPGPLEEPGAGSPDTPAADSGDKES